MIEVNAVNLRDFSDDTHGSVDDTPYGGGAGMVMKPEPIYKALEHLGALPTVPNQERPVKKIENPRRTVLLSPRGKQFDQRIAEEWSRLKEIVFVCGRYEGVDQRVADYMVDEEISVGPYVLAGGELGALVMIEAIARLIPGVIGNEGSLKEETFSLEEGQGREYPQYTKPADFNGWQVPDILLSGDHKKIKEWRKGQSA